MAFILLTNWQILLAPSFAIAIKFQNSFLERIKVRGVHKNIIRSSFEYWTNTMFRKRMLRSFNLFFCLFHFSISSWFSPKVSTQSCLFTTSSVVDLRYSRFSTCKNTRWVFSPKPVSISSKTKQNITFTYKLTRSLKNSRKFAIIKAGTISVTIK